MSRGATPRRSLKQCGSCAGRVSISRQSRFDPLTKHRTPREKKRAMIVDELGSSSRRALETLPPAGTTGAPAASKSGPRHGHKIGGLARRAKTFSRKRDRTWKRDTGLTMLTSPLPKSHPNPVCAPQNPQRAFHDSWNAVIQPDSAHGTISPRNPAACEARAGRIRLPRRGCDALPRFSESRPGPAAP